MAKSELARERARLAQEHRQQTLSSIMRAAASAGALPQGQDPTIDAWRHLTANLLVMQPGQWQHDALVVPVQWDALDQTVLADLLLISGRADVIKALDIPWATLLVSPDHDIAVYGLRHDLHQPLSASLAQMKDCSWLVTRLLRGEFNAHSPTTLGFGLSMDLGRMERVFRTAQELGLGPDTRVPTYSLGLDVDDVRFVDVALVHDNAKLTKTLLSKARWTKAEQAIPTLWALSLRACQEWSMEKGHHASLTAGTLARHLLALDPDPLAPLSMTWKMQSCLGQVTPMDFIRNDPELSTVPLAFACLLAMHNNQHASLPRAAHPIHQWCVDKIVSTPQLLDEVASKVIEPLLDRLSSATLGEMDRGLDWSGGELIDAIVPHLPAEQTTQLARRAFDRMLERLQGRREVEDVCAKLSNSLPVQSALPRASLGEDQALRLLKILAAEDVPWDSWGDSPANHPDVAPIIDMFERALAPLLVQRLADMAHLVKTDDGRTLSTRLALLGQTRLADRPVSKPRM